MSALRASSTVDAVQETASFSTTHHAHPLADCKRHILTNAKHTTRLHSPPMKFTLSLIAASLVTTTLAVAQSGTSIAEGGCATPAPTTAEMQSIYDWSSTGAQSLKTTSGTDTVPLTIHIVGNSSGLGYYPLSTLWKMLCNTNERYQPVGIYFQVKWPIRYINNTSYYTHTAFDGYQMMDQYNVANTINVYFVQDPAGACGYFSPGADGVAIAKSCGSTVSTTLTHELGHFLGLPHTFYGWEGGNTPSNPERVTRSGSTANCSSAGDGFCDTEADYQSNRWQCPYSGSMSDVNGDVYRPDSSMYMGYANDACMSRFSPLQMARMQNRLATQPNRVNLLAYAAQPYESLDTPAISYPVDSLYTNDRTIRWQAVPGANYYHVQVNRVSNGQVLNDTLVSGTSMLLTDAMVDYNRYRVRITPLASSNVCALKMRERFYHFSPNGIATSVEGAGAANAQSVSVFPNPAGVQGWTVTMGGVPRGTVDITLVAPSGAVVRSLRSEHAGGALRAQMNAQGLANGLYFIRVQGGDVQWTGRVLLQQ